MVDLIVKYNRKYAMRLQKIRKLK